MCDSVLVVYRLGIAQKSQSDSCKPNGRLEVWFSAWRCATCGHNVDPTASRKVVEGARLYLNSPPVVRGIVRLEAMYMDMFQTHVAARVQLAMFV